MSRGKDKKKQILCKIYNFLKNAKKAEKKVIFPVENLQFCVIFTKWTPTKGNTAEESMFFIAKSAGKIQAFHPKRKVKNYGF